MPLRCGCSVKMFAPMELKAIAYVFLLRFCHAVAVLFLCTDCSDYTDLQQNVKLDVSRIKYGIL